MHYRVGRLSDNHLVLPDDSVSSYHAEIREAGGVYFLNDLGSTNGTFINRNRISMSELKSGDMVHFGLVRKYFDGNDLVDEPPETDVESSASNATPPEKSSRPRRNSLIAVGTVAAVLGAIWITRSSSSFPVDRVSRATVQVFVSDSSGEWCSAGSGFLALERGIVITNAHVVVDRSCKVLSIGLVDDSGDRIIREVSATLVAKNDSLDLALLRISGSAAEGYPQLDIAEKSAKRGDEVRVFGFPGIGGSTITATSGIISGIDEEEEYPYFKTSADISSGNSGGPVVNAAGQVIGVATAAVLQEIECSDNDRCYSGGNSLGLIRPIEWLKELYP